MSTLKTILIGIVIFIITSLLGWIGWNTRDVPNLNEKFENVKTQLDRHDELFNQEIEKRHLMEIEIVKLQTKLDQR